MYSENRYQNMERFDVPEILRISLDEIFLQAMQLLRMRSDISCDSKDVVKFLMSSLDAPSLNSVENAISNLVELGALASVEKQDNLFKLTTFGEALARLPVGPRIGKMLLVGLYFECFDSILTIATASCYRTPFVLPLNDRDKVCLNDDVPTVYISHTHTHTHRNERDNPSNDLQLDRIPIISHF